MLGRRTVPRCFVAIALLQLCVFMLPAATAVAEPMGPDLAAEIDRLQRQAARRWQMEWDDAYGQVRSLWGTSAPQAADPETAAATFLKDHHTLFGLGAELADLTIASRRESVTGTHLTYAQTWNGMPVFDGGIDVHVSAAGEVVLVHNRYARPAALAGLRPVPRLSETDAVKAAQADVAGAVRHDATGRPRPPRAPTLTELPVLGVYRGSGMLVAAYRLTAGGVRYTISAETGAVLERSPRARYAMGTGRVFVFDPGLVRRDRPLRGLTRLATEPVTYVLEGPHVRLFNATRPFLTDSGCYQPLDDGDYVLKRPPQQPSPSFIFTRTQPGFEHTNVYFHIDRSQRYIQSLGFSDLLRTGILADAHAFTGQNSYFCPGGPANPAYLAFGDGAVNEAEDPDAILHEYGHALQDAASGGRYGVGGQSGAMGEGFGDYWAFSAKPGATAPACLFQLLPDRRCVNGPHRYPTHYLDDPSGDSDHHNGRIWSRALFDLHAALGKSTADRLILESHIMGPTNPRFLDGAQALLHADDHLYAGQFKRVICKRLIERGIVAPQRDEVAHACPVLHEGHVRSADGTPVPNAVISTSLDSRRARSDATGHYLLLTETPPEDYCCTPYTLTVSAPGFRTFSVSHVWGAHPVRQTIQLLELTAPE